MARHWFLGDMSAWAMALGADETSVDSQSGKRALMIPSASITFWTAQSGGTQYTSLLDAIDTPITAATADTHGEFNPIQGPDADPEIWYMWADGSGGAGPRRLVVATDLADTVVANRASLLDLIGTVADLQTLNATSLGVVEYDTVAGAYPLRPADSRIYVWVGSTAPPVGGGYMQGGRDFWLNPTPVA